MTEHTVVLAIPSKGRLMEQVQDLFASAGLEIRKNGHSRGYRGTLDGIAGVEIAFLSATEIAEQLRLGLVDLGITGEDLMHEAMEDAERRIEFAKPLGIGKADVVTAVPDCWIDVTRMSDLEDVAGIFHRAHGRRLRVATKYMNLTRRYFALNGISGYRIVESLGATEGTPAAGTSEMIVDITSTGATLKANHLRVLEDGVILQSQAVLFALRDGRGKALEAALAAILERFGAAGV